jgi:hypothetical protein
MKQENLNPMIDPIIFQLSLRMTIKLAFVMSMMMMISSPVTLAQTSTSTAIVATPDPTPAWLKKLTLGGDLRLRYNNLTSRSGHDEGLFLRARLAFISRVNDHLTANFRLSTGATESGNLWTTANQQLGDEGARKSFFLDIASLDYRFNDSLVITGGRATHPFFTAGKNEMIWSADLMHEGVHAKYSHDWSGLKTFANLAYNQWTDTGANNSDLNLVAAQIGATLKGESLATTVAIASYHNNGIKGSAISSFARGTALGNSSESGNFTQNYELTNVEAELAGELLDVPVSIYGAFVMNRATSNENDGFLLGVRAGRLKEPGDWSLETFVRELKKDAVIGNFNDSITLGGSDNRAIRTTLQHQLAPGNVVNVSGIWGTQNLATTKDGYTRVLVEFLASF